LNNISISLFLYLLTSAIVFSDLIQIRPLRVVAWSNIAAAAAAVAAAAAAAAAAGETQAAQRDVVPDIHSKMSYNDEAF
jgi:hypothetical protein